MDGGRIRHRWCMCAVSHGYGRLGRVGMGVVYSMHAGQSQGVGLMSRDAGALIECEEIKKHRRPCALLWVGSSRNWSVFLERP